MHIRCTYILCVYIYLYNKGDIAVRIKEHSEVKNITNVLHVPDLNTNLLSINSLTSKDRVLVFDNKICNFDRKDNFHVKGEIVA